jgi:hypothetical protein
VIGLLAALVLAASDDAQKAAGAHFQRGVSLAARSEYAAALTEFEEAYRLAPAWQVLFNIGVVREKLGEPTLALEALDAYLAQGGAAVPKDKRAVVEQELAALRKEVAELVVSVDGEPAAIEIDGQERKALPIYVLPGRHRISARREGRAAQADVEAHRGDRVVVALVIPEAPPPAPVVEEPAKPAPVVLTPVEQPAPAPIIAPAPPVVEAPAPWYRRWYVWTAVAGVVAAGVVTSVAVVETRKPYDVRVDTP